MKNKRKNIKFKVSIRTILLSAMCVLIAFFVLTFITITSMSGLIKSLDDASFRTLYNQCEGSASRLSTQLNMISLTARTTADALQLEIQDYFSLNGMSSSDLNENTEGLDAVIGLSQEKLMPLLRYISVSGAFVMLNSSYSGGDSLAAYYLRNASPGSGSVSNYTLLRGPGGIVGDWAVPYDGNWQYEQDAGSAVNMDFFSLPQQAARDNPRLDSRDWGYWSMPFRLSPADSDIITFTTPLLDADMTPIGVFGVELSASYLSRLMPGENLPFDGSFYMIGAVSDGEIVIQSCISSSVFGSLFLTDNTENVRLMNMNRDEYYTVYLLSGSVNLYDTYISLDLYDRNSPFVQQDYFLHAIAPESAILQNSNGIENGLAISVAASVAIALLVSLIFSRAISWRIENLENEVKQFDPEKSMTLSPTNIKEIDSLSNVLEHMNQNVISYAGRMSTIVDLVGIPMGAFEIQLKQDMVFFTTSLFKLMKIYHGESESHYMVVSDFNRIFPMVTLPDQEGRHIVLEIEYDIGGDLDFWLRIRLIRQKDVVYGTVNDISDEIRRRKWLEFERDYDPLTHLLNRNSYISLMSKRIIAAPYQFGVLLFGDLDNLKYTNDTYGHDMGDRYIQAAAGALREFERYGGVVARISGDEFAVYLHGGSSRQELRDRVDAVIKNVRKTEVILPDDTVQRVSISVGLSYYPFDADNIDTLIRYADFAMYEIKHSVKGGTKEFDKDSYAVNSHILNKPTQLDRLIQGKRFKYAFQPIIDASNGSVFGYEALLRPLMREFHTPLELLKLAKNQSKLNSIEKLTMESVFSWVSEHSEMLGQQKIFINLIANQILTLEEYMDLFSLLPDNKGSVVMEVTEYELESNLIMANKNKLLRDFGLKMALSDYSNHCHDGLQSLSPEFVKISMSVIRNIDSDPEKQDIVRKIAEYSGNIGIIVIAEGVESSAELETVIRLGIRYVQGYYLGCPELQQNRQLKKNCLEAKRYYDMYKESN